MIEVVVPCSCPGKPHKQDSVSMPDQPDIRIGTAVMTAMKLSPSSLPEMEAAIADALVHVAPREWTFVDADGQPLEVTSENIDARLTWLQGGMEVAEKASDLYGSGNPTGVFAPLLRARSKASPPLPMDDSISPTPSPGLDTPSSDRPSLRTVTGGKRSGAKAS